MTESMNLRQRHQAARLLHELSRPTSAAVIAQLPVRPGVASSVAAVQHGSALSVREFWTTVGRLEAVGVVQRTAEGLALDRARLDRMINDWVADSPLDAVLGRHPRLRPFVDWGRVTRTPTEPSLLDELYAGLAELFPPGGTVSEGEVNARIAEVHDDPAEIRRGLVDRGWLRRAPGSGSYRRP